MTLSYPPMTTKSSPASCFQLRTLELCWLGLGFGSGLGLGLGSGLGLGLG